MEPRARIRWALSRRASAASATHRGSADSMPSAWSPPSPRPVPTARWAVVGCSASMARSPAVAILQASSHSAWALFGLVEWPVGESAIWPYPRVVPDPLRGLTEAQREAAAHSGGAVLVPGGAGTGKTRTLVARFAWLVEQGTAPERIALLSATPAMAD